MLTPGTLTLVHAQLLGAPGSMPPVRQLVGEELQVTHTGTLSSPSPSKSTHATLTGCDTTHDDDATALRFRSPARTRAGGA